MKIKDFGKYIRDIRDSKDLSLRQVDQYSEVTYSNLSMIENGTRKATPLVLKELARVYNLDYIDLLQKCGYIDLAELEKLENVKQIPLLGKIQAGVPTTMFADVIDYIDIPADMARGNKELFALKTKGKSMEPNFIEGDILIFEKTEDCENGQFCAVTVNGDDATFKKVTKIDTGIMLQPLNPAFETKFYTNEQIASLPVTIIGILKQIRRNF
nr:MAG TPA: SOS-response transcriptional repressors (RecA-mediated autopeptidases) [Caudoviricetes sp.]